MSHCPVDRQATTAGPARSQPSGQESQATDPTRYSAGYTIVAFVNDSIALLGQRRAAAVDIAATRGEIVFRE